MNKEQHEPHTMRLSKETWKRLYVLKSRGIAWEQIIKILLSSYELSENKYEIPPIIHATTSQLEGTHDTRNQ